MSIDIIDDTETAWIDLQRVSAITAFVLDRMRLDPECTVSIAFVDEDRMSELHRHWMDEPGPTDVMSFPMDDLKPGAPEGPRPLGILGDIVLCPSVAERQAEQAGHAPENEVDLLLVHGMLHLLGHDHAEPEEHRVMFDLQGNLLEMWQQRGQVAP